MDLDEIRALLAVADAGSFVAAARTLGQPRTTLRRRLDTLEARLGVILVERAARGARLTTAGAAAAEEGRVLIGRARRLRHAVQAAEGWPDRPLRLVWPHGLPSPLVVWVLTEMLRQIDGLRLDAAPADNPRAALTDDADLVVTLDGRIVDGPWTRFPLRPVRERLLGDERYLARRGRPETLAELREHPLLVWAPAGVDPTALPLRGGGVLPVEPRMASPDIHILREMAAAGAGLAYVPHGDPERPQPTQARLVPVLPERIGRKSSLDLLVPDGLLDMPRVAEVVAFCQRLVRTIQGAGSAGTGSSEAE